MVLSGLDVEVDDGDVVDDVDERSRHDTLASVSDLIDRVAAVAATDLAARSVLQVLVGDRPTDPAALGTVARAVNGERRRVAIDDFVSASLRTSEVIARLPGVTTRQAVSKMRQAKTLMGRRIGRETYFPAWQFGPAGLRDDLPRILVVLRRYVDDDAVAADRIMRLEREELGGTSLVDALGWRHGADAAWQILGALGDRR